jgi:hypothetical protein
MRNAHRDQTYRTALQISRQYYAAYDALHECSPLYCFVRLVDEVLTSSYPSMESTRNQGPSRSCACDAAHAAHVHGRGGGRSGGQWSFVSSVACAAVQEETHAFSSVTDCWSAPLRAATAGRQRLRCRLAPPPVLQNHSVWQWRTALPAGAHSEYAPLPPLSPLRNIAPALHDSLSCHGSVHYQWQCAMRFQHKAALACSRAYRPRAPHGSAANRAASALSSRVNRAA